MSTPPLSRSSSSSSLEDLSDNDSKALDKPSSKKPGGLPAQGSSSSKVPSTSNRPLQPASAWSKGQMPVGKGQVRSSDPLLSPRTGAPEKPTLPPPSSAQSINVPSTTHQASMPSTSTAVSTSSSVPAQQMPDNHVVADDLSPKVLSCVNVSLQAGGNLAPERLGELLVAVESKGGKINLAGDKINRILRGGLIIHDFESASGIGKQDINVIKGICEPFMFQQLDTPELEKSRKKFISEFGKVAQKFDDLSTKVNAREWTKFSPMQDLMDPIMKPVLGILCGAGNTLDTSELPDPIKKLLLSIDKHVIAWFKNNGTDKPADLLQARKSALVGFLSTRSLAYVWYTKSSAEQTIDNMHLTKLLAYMNSYVSNQIDAFVTDILLTQKDQPIEARKYIEVLTKKTALKSKPAVPALALGERLAGKGVLSPRAAASSGSHGAKSGSVNSDNRTEKEMKAKLMKLRVEHARFIDQLAKTAGLDAIDYQCYQHVKEIVVKMSERGFEQFKKDPVKSLKKYAGEFYAKPANHKRVKDGLPDKFNNALDALNLKLVGNPFDEDDGDDIKRVPSLTKTSESREAEQPSETEPSDEPEIKTKSSEEENRS